MATIVGEDALMKRLDRLAKDSTRRKMARPALREASGEIRKKAKRLVVEETGLLKKSIGNVVRTKRGIVFAIVGPRHGFKQQVVRESAWGSSGVQDADPTKYAHLVEFGTAHSAAKPFLRPAYDSTPTTKIIARRLGIELDKEAKKK